MQDFRTQAFAKMLRHEVSGIRLHGLPYEFVSDRDMAEFTINDAWQGSIKETPFMSKYASSKFQQMLTKLTLLCLMQ